jgi:multidrug efflux pump subunit AcrA (membrane-fusion protein)
MSPEPVVHPVSRRGLRIAAVLAAAIAIVVVGGGIASRAANSSHLRQWTAAQAQPVVTVTQPQPGNGSAVLALPGRLEAYSRAPIYARVNGYLKSWKVDIGASVQAGQLLAEIEAPDLDQQLSQARADLLTARANAALASTTARRWQGLVKSDAVSQQDVDMKNGDWAAKAAIVKATEANVDRLAVMEGFKRITAPLFVVSDTQKLRLYVSVPQNYAAQINSGTQAQITVPERPGRTFIATVQTTSQSVDPASGSTLVQLAVDNETGELVPGAFANVRLDLPPAAASLSIPASALIFDSRGARVATIGPDNRVALKPVKIARDLGNVIEISSGLAANDRIIDSPPDGIGKGDQVRVAPASAGGGLLTAAASPRAPAGTKANETK